MTKPKLRIALVHPFFDMYGGAEKVLFVLANAIAKEYGSCEIYTSWFHEDFAQYLGENVFVKTARNEALQSETFGQKFNPALVKDMKTLGTMMTGNFDVIIATHWPSNIAVNHALTKAKTATATKTLYYCFEVDNGLYHQEIYGKENSHVLEGKNWLGKLKARIAFLLFVPWKKQDKAIVKTFTNLVSISHNNKRDIGKIYGINVESKTKVIPTFVDADLFHPLESKEPVQALRKKFNINAEQKVILSLCRLGQSKRVDFIISSFKQLLDNIKAGKEKLILVVAGKGPDEEKLKQLARSLGIENHVRFIGFVDDKDLVPLYNLCGIFVYAGLEANYVLTAFEAMACEKPVVVPQSRFKEVISEQEGCAVDAHQIEAYVQAYKKILGNPKQTKSISKAARQRVLRDYTEARFFERFKALFEAP